MIHTGLRITDLTINLATGPAVLSGVSLQIAPGEILGIAGESGSGKTTLLRSLIGDIRSGMRHGGGTVTWNEDNLLDLPANEARLIRGAEISLVAQHASSALTPTRKVGDLVLEPAVTHGRLLGDARSHVLKALDEVGLPDPAQLAGRYPHQLSGGQRQRVALAVALSARPSLLLLDEPTSGLDATTQRRVLDLLQRLAIERGLTVVVVTHDLGVVSTLCNTLAIMYAGEIVETGPTADLLHQPQHPYTNALLDAIPRMEDATLPYGLAGHPPTPGGQPRGCWFESRCPRTRELCRTQHPDLLGSPSVRCHFPGISMPTKVELTPTRPTTESNAQVILETTNLAVSYPKGTELAVDRVDLTIRRGEVLGIVGESGSGKSTLAKAIAGLSANPGGEITFYGEPIASKVSQRTPLQLKAVQLVFQHPDQALNPRHTIWRSIARTLDQLRNLRGSQARSEAISLLEEVGLSERHLDKMPRQLSGGEQQRAALARSLAAQPQVLICDEVVSALDVSVQARILSLLKKLSLERNLALIFISHDLAVVRALADQIIVLRNGKVCESGAAADIFANPSHPYTIELLAASLEPPQRNLTNNQQEVPVP